MSEWMTLLPLFVLVAGALVVMAVDAFSADPKKSELGLLSFVVLMIAGGSAVALLSSDAGEVSSPIISAYLSSDKLSLFFDVVICAGAGLSVLLASGYLQEHDLERGEYYVVLLLSTFGALVLARAADLLTLFIGLETMSLGAYCLIGFRRRSKRAGEASVKYFLLGSFAAAILLFGSALLYGATGETNLVLVGKAVSEIAGGTTGALGSSEAPLVVMGMLLVLVGLAFKVSAVPFHMWTPDAYEGAPTPTTVFMAVAVKASAFAVLVRVLLTAFSEPTLMAFESGWPPVLAFLALVSMVFGNLAALGQKSVKRMLAYSSIAHAGYLLVGIVAMTKQGEAAMAAVLYYLLAYTVSTALAFGALILVGSKGKEAVSYEDLAGVGRRHPWAAVPLLLGVLTLMGFPPSAGFFAKYAVFSAAVAAGGPLLVLAVVGVLTSAVGAYYYLKVIVFMYMKEPEANAPVAVPMRNLYVASALLLSAYFVLRMGIAPGAYLEMATSAARPFFPA